MSSMRDMFVGIYFQDEATKIIENLDRQMDAVEDTLTGVGKKLGISERNIGQFGNAGINAAKDVERGFAGAKDSTRQFDVGLSKAMNSIDGLKRTIKGMVGIVAGVFAVDKIKEFGLSSIEASANMQAMESQFSQVFDGMEKQATSGLEKIAGETGMLENRLKGSYIKMAAFAKTTGMDTASALGLTERATLAAADSAAFYDRSIEDVSENLQSFLKGNYENDAALGISATETTRNAAAMKLYGKQFQKLAEDQKQLTLLQMVEDGNKLSGALGQAAREGDAYENVMGNLKQTWTDFKVAIAGPLLQPFVDGVQMATKWIQGFDTNKIVNGFENIKSFAGTVKDTITAFVNDTGDVSGLWQNFGFSKETSDSIASFGDTMHSVVVVGIDAASEAFDGFKTGVKWVIDNKDIVISATTGIAGGFAAFKTISTVKTALDLFKSSTLLSTIATQGFNAALKANPIGMVVTAIGLLLTAGVYLYQNWDTVRAKTGELWNKLGAFKGVATLVLGPIGQIIRTAVTMAENWDSTKSVWENVWNGIKLSAASAVNDVIGSINWLIEKINAIPGVNVPIIPKVEWGNVNNGQEKKAINKVSAGGLVPEHATGLERVPYDGYFAKLHKDESVLTAQQSNALRSAGMLSQNSDGTPELNIGGGGGGGATQQAQNAGGGGHQFIFQITGDSPQDIAQKVREVISDMLDSELQTT
ncbi:hypothetical protein ACIQYL_25020 [Lysinibacillus xylanilyticus]|uniref:hypothetical protein n=1 Tax=Lysinibacillus xylanilyticus TaxID=582475 RepID=UPI00382A38BE